MPYVNVLLFNFICIYTLESDAIQRLVEILKECGDKVDVKVGTWEK